MRTTNQVVKVLGCDLRDKAVALVPGKTWKLRVMLDYQLYCQVRDQVFDEVV